MLGKLTPTLLFLIVIISATQESSMVDIYGDLQCYQCYENSLNNNHVTCDTADEELDVGLDIEIFALIQELEDESEEKIGKLLDKLSPQNPCKAITRKVLEIMEEQADSGGGRLLPIFLEEDGADEKTKYLKFKSLIHTIQFQKRKDSNLLAIQISLRDGDDPVIFVLQEKDPTLAFIPHTHIFYAAF